MNCETDRETILFFRRLELVTENDRFAVPSQSWSNGKRSNRIFFVHLKNFPSRQRPLKENLRIAEEILGANSTLSRWLLNKETSVNKYCKLTKFIHTTYWKLIYKRKKSDRPTPDEVCLPPNDISNYFSKISNSSKWRSSSAPFFFINSRYFVPSISVFDRSSLIKMKMKIE